MEEDLLIKILLSLLLVYYCEEYERSVCYEEDKNKEIVYLNKNIRGSSVVKSDNNFELKNQSFELKNYDFIASEQQLISNEIIDKDTLQCKININEVEANNKIDKPTTSSANENYLEQNILVTKENDHVLCKDDDVTIEESISSEVHMNYTISNINVLIAGIKISVEFEKLFKFEREKIFKVEKVLCDLKSIEGNLLILKAEGEVLKVKLFYNGIARIRAKCICVDCVNNGNLYCNTKNIILYKDFCGTVDSYVEAKFIENRESINIPVKIDLLATEFNIKAILQEATFLYDIKESYYKAFELIGYLNMNMALLKETYVEM